MYINLQCVRVYVYRYIMKKASVDWFHQPLIHYYILPIFSIKSMDISKSEHRIVIAGKCDGFFSTRYLEWIKNKIKLLDVIWGPISVPFRSFDLSSIISFFFSLFLYRSLCTQFSLISGENVEPFILFYYENENSSKPSGIIFLEGSYCERLTTPPSCVGSPVAKSSQKEDKLQVS